MQSVHPPTTWRCYERFLRCVPLSLGDDEMFFRQRVKQVTDAIELLSLVQEHLRRQACFVSVRS
jgi:hypothetical protein